MRHRLAVLTLCLVAAAQAAAAPQLAVSSAATTTSAAPADCPDSAAMQAAGFDSAKLCRALAEFHRPDINFHSLVIERHGAIVTQAYRRGKDRSVYSLFANTVDFDASRRHDMRSISKSITSLLWGIAQGQGKTPPLNTPVLDLLPDQQQYKNGGREAITIAHLLSMSSGLEWNEPNIYNSANDEFGLYWHSSQARYVFKQALAKPPGTVFNYNGGGTAVLAQILSERVGMSLPDYARKYLFEPLGITDWEWLNDFRGRPLAFAGVRLRPTDLARIGQMVLQKGQWQGHQIVPAEWIEASTSPQVKIGDGMQYGYQWWLGSSEALGHKVAWSAGFGNGGQRLYVVPELDLVVAITAGDYNDARIQNLGQRLFDCIVASVQQ